MTTDIQSAPVTEHLFARLPLRVGFTATVLAAAAVLGVVLSFWWVDGERSRDLRTWQDRLGIVADSRADAVSAWVASQLAVVSDLGNDQAVQLYAAELGASARRSTRDRGDDPLAQRQYLENMLVVTAERTGFADVVERPTVGANVPRAGRAGLAILDADMHLIATTPDLPPLSGAQRGFVASRMGAEGAALYGPYAAEADGSPAMMFAAPLRDATEDRTIGLVVGIRPVGDDLYPLLRQPGATEATAEAVLLDVRGAAVAYLSPLADGTQALGRTLALDTPELAAAWAVRNPGGFALRRDYRNQPVLVASRTVPGTDWVLAYMVGRDEALGESNARLTRMLLGLLLLVGAVSAGLVAVWRHGASQRALATATRFRDLADRFEQQSKFIRRLTDSQPNGIFIASPDDRVAFANRHVADKTGADDADALVGKELAAVFGPAEARRHAAGVHDALENERVVSNVERREELRDGKFVERVLRTEYVPLSETVFAPAGVLAVEQDITDAVVLRERNARLLEQLVDTLLGVVDRRDPYAAYQSARVARVAAAIAQEMGLDAILVDTVRKAASLMNIGKILVPRELLVKTGKLSNAEITQVREALLAGASLVEGVEFEGPVVETLRQMREHYDGSGTPHGLAGDRILMSARVVAVANAFVGMVSPRAHRAGMEFDDALDRLFAESGVAFDRSVLVALANYLDNRGGRAEWAFFANAPTVIDVPE